MDADERRRFADNHLLAPAERAALFAELWKARHPRLRAYCASFHGLGAEDGEEIAGDALLRAFERADGYRPEMAFEPWLYSIARRLVFDRLRSARRRFERAVDPVVFDDGFDSRYPGPEEECESNAERDLVRGFMEGLAEKDRELAFLVYGESLKLADAARITGEPIGTVKWRLHAIRKRLSRCMEAEHG
jgi:RNA polymerase sigma factor (sigma-70 family)